MKKRIREIVYSPDILREDFYSDKVRMVLFQKKNWKKELVKDKEVLEYYRYLLDKYTRINNKLPDSANNKEETRQRSFLFCR